VVIKILTVAFAVFGLSRAVFRWRRGAGLFFELLFWALLWSGVGVVVFVPHYTDRAAHWMGVSSGFNALVFLSILGLLFAVYRLLVRTQTLQRDLTKLIRAQALAAPERVTSKAE
jgi:hypothetical protein